MRRLGTALVVVLLVFAGATVPAFGLTGDVVEQQSSPTTATPAGDDADGERDGTPSNSTANGTAPGAKLAGVLGVQRAELGGDLEQRRFQRQLETAATNDSKARVVATQANQSGERLAELEAELDSLRAARENGSISRDQYRARAAQVSARIRVVESVSNRTAAAADRLPAETLERNGVNVTAIRQLRENAAELSGPEVAAIAREIAGRNAGRGFGPDDTGRDRADRGPPERADGAAGPNETDDRGRANESTSSSGGDRPGQSGASGSADESERGNEGHESERRGNETSPNGGTDGNASDGNGPPERAGGSSESSESGTSNESSEPGKSSESGKSSEAGGDLTVNRSPRAVATAARPVRTEGTSSGELERTPRHENAPEGPNGS